MALLHISTHYLLVNSVTKSIKHPASPEIDDGLRRIFLDAKSQFLKRNSKEHGHCEHDKAIGYQWLQTRLDDSGDSSLWATQLLESIGQKLNDEAIDTDSHWLVAHEKTETENLVWLVQLRHRSGLCLNDLQQVSESQVLDMGKMGVCLCADLTGIASETDTPYLIFSSGFGDRTLQAQIREIFSFTDLIDTRSATIEFMSLIQEYADQQGQESLPREAAEICINMDQTGEPVSMKSVSEELDSDQGEALINFVISQNKEPEQTLLPDRKSLKQFIRFAGRTKNLSISFSNESLGKTIRFDPQDETLVISDLPDSLLHQLKKG